MLKLASEGAGTVWLWVSNFFIIIIFFRARYAISCVSEDSRSLMGGCHVVHRGVVEDFAMT